MTVKRTVPCPDRVTICIKRFEVSAMTVPCFAVVSIVSIKTLGKTAVTNQWRFDSRTKNSLNFVRSMPCRVRVVFTLMRNPLYQKPISDLK